MVRRILLLLVPALLVLGQQSWKDKRVAEWTEEDARQVLTDSPWAKQTTPELERNSGFGRGNGGGMGRNGGWGGLGGGMGSPRIGSGPGMGGDGTWGGGSSGGTYPSGGNTGGNYPDDPNGDGRQPREMPAATVRWESAMPVQSAHLKTKDKSGPSVRPEEYTLIVTGLSNRYANQDIKPKARLVRKEKGKKSISSSSARVLSGEDGPIVVFCFPRSNEIGRNDGELIFDATIGRIKVRQSFFPDEMLYQGKLEL
jgi:hypothetical protein